MVAGEKRRIPLFFLLTFLWTWTAYFAIILLKLSPYQGAGMGLLIFGGCSPTFVGLIMVLARYSKEDRAAYLKSIVGVRRISLSWWMFMLLCFPAVFAAAIGLDMLLGGSPPEMTNLRAVIANPISFLPLFLLSFMSGPFSEELGWRGYALKPMIGRLGFAKAAVLLGIIWGVWHLPLYLMPETWHGQMGFGLYGFVSFMALSIGMSLLMAAAYVSTGFSILSAMLLHLGSNFTGQLLQMISNRAELFRSIFVLILGAAMYLFLARRAEKGTMAKIIA